jgi:hypothetical protein
MPEKLQTPLEGTDRRFAKKQVELEMLQTLIGHTENSAIVWRSELFVVDKPNKLQPCVNELTPRDTRKLSASGSWNMKNINYS